LDEYLGIFFSFFGLLWDQFISKTLGQPRGVKNGPIMLKFGTIVDWMNTLGVLILIFENLFFDPIGPFYITKKFLLTQKLNLFCICIEGQQLSQVRLACYYD